MGKNIALLIGFSIIISITPFLFLFENFSPDNFLYDFANISGLIGATLLLWQLLLGNRRVFRKFTPDFISLNRLHQLLGKYGLFFVFIHPFLQAYKFAYGFDFVFIPRLGTQFLVNVAFGRMAFYLFLILIVSSVILRKKIKYRPWLYIHYLAYPMMILVFVHATLAGSFIAQISFIKYYWWFLVVIFSLTLATRILRFLNIGKYKYRLIDITKHTGDITVFTFTPLGQQIVPKPGQFVYLRKGKFSESHPFTIMEYDDTTGNMKFGIKRVGKYTNSLNILEKGCTVYVDGPYGVFTLEGQNNSPKLILAGGIGITPFVELVKKYGNKNTTLFYSNKTHEDALFSSLFTRKLGKNYIEVITNQTTSRPQAVSGRLSKNIFLTYVDRNLVKSANIFICGSSGFMKEMKNMLIDLGAPKNNIFYEKFEL
ncbi:ferric reductase-like transmembrane domain-containing protein [Candidatus Woesebacteria bacterium]|nr:MAG: ferric reductase-like transmembrane domain-containing protein [Candidatus Woesebacteria bacterium]